SLETSHRDDGLVVRGHGGGLRFRHTDLAHPADSFERLLITIPAARTTPLKTVLFKNESAIGGTAWLIRVGGNRRWERERPLAGKGQGPFQRCAYARSGGRRSALIAMSGGSRNVGDGHLGGSGPHGEGGLHGVGRGVDHGDRAVAGVGHVGAGAAEADRHADGRGADRDGGD